MSSSSHKELGWHTEDAFSSCRADYVGLLCLRSPDVTPTTLSYLRVSEIPEDIAELLWQPRFHIEPDSSHDAGSGILTGDRDTAFHRLAALRRSKPKLPVLEGSPDAPVLRIDRDFTTAPADDGPAQAALRWIVEHLDDNLYELALGPGDVGFIDNRNVVHGRRPFRPRYDGNDRWLKRINVVADLRRTRPGRSGTAVRVVG